MLEGKLTPPTFVTVCIILVLLTVLTTAISFFPLPGPGHVIAGLAIAVCKASLVVMFFMHVLVSPRLTTAVVIVSCFWLGILFVLTLADYVTRDLIPYMPGR